MEQYTSISYALAQQLTLSYSSSFGLSSKLFSKSIRPHIYAIYGLVRIADEIVDTYKAANSASLLDELEQEVYGAITRQYSTNPIVHAFALTAEKYHIDRDIIAPFFKSMRMDILPQEFTRSLYNEYIHGSAEVVGLMCLKVFCGTDHALYRRLASGAEALGAAYQKVNFLRDLAEDHQELGRMYFPGLAFETFSESDKQNIIRDIEKDFAHAVPAIKRLPSNCRGAVETSYTYYSRLLAKLKTTPASTIKSQRVRISDAHKAKLFALAAIKQKASR